jgi:glycosyltransferase involved in cell wall biosynthesis
MQFALLHSRIMEQDAIGADVAGMYDVLSASQECGLYGEHVEVSGRRQLSRAQVQRILADHNNVVIYHHSGHWGDGESLLRSAAARIIFKYHNITPPSFFAEIDSYWEACVRGREQTYRFADHYRNALWMSDSLYNLAELGIDALPQRAVVPPFLSTLATRRTHPDAMLLKGLIESRTFNVLLVGRFVPNKGHHLFVRVLAEYKKRYGQDITGIIAGKLDPAFQTYYDSTMAEAEEAGVAGNLNYVGCVPDTVLMSYFLGCDAYLCTSDHEGFCVPVVEAQSTCLPVVAKRTAAVQETLGPGQILLGSDPAEYADGLHRLRSDESFWRGTVERGAANVAARFTAGKIAADFTSALQSYLDVQL